MNEIYVVIDSNGYVESYRKFESAKQDVIEALMNHAELFSYSAEELADAIAEFNADHEAGRIDCSTYLGEYEIRCVKSAIIED